MFEIQTRNAISPVIYNKLDKNLYNVSADTQNPDAILVRSADMLSDTFGDRLLSIARAGAGYNNIPVDRCTEAGICVFNTPGANANAVCELVLCAILLASRDVLGGIEWAKTLKGQGDAVAKAVEKGKSQFVGPEIAGKTLGILGLGAVGGLVANAAISLGMKVIGYDPFLSVDSAWHLSRSVIKAASEEAMIAEADYLTIHVPMNKETRGKFNKEYFSKMKDGAVLINLARGELVNNDDVKEALDSGKLRRYVTDFPNDEVLLYKNVICIPHLGASTPESEDNCAEMAAAQTAAYLTTGSIRNSVNLPACDLEPTSEHRIAVIHRNVPNVIGYLTSKLGEMKINIENMVNKSRGDYAYTVLDVAEPVSAEIAATLSDNADICRVRVIC